jgi:hypothetical protein
MNFNFKKIRRIKKNSGAAMLISVVFFLFISLSIIAGLVAPSIREFRNASVNLNSKKSYFLAESGVEDAVYRISKSMLISGSETLTLNNNSATTTITSFPGNVQQITSLGDVLNYQRKVGLTLQTGAGTVFKYGTQAGQGGFIFHNNAYLNGSLYSNGNIAGSNGAYITGDAFVAGSSGSIDNMCIGGVQTSTCSGSSTGNAHAHSVTNSDVTGTIYCQTGLENNKSCNTSQADPTVQDLPISDAMIAQWKTDATNDDATIGDITISTPTTLGPKKITGNLTINSILTIANTIYVTGNVIINGTVKLASSYGATSGIIMSDGYLNIGNGVIFQDSGTAGSYILLLSNSVCDSSMSGSPCNEKNAMEVSNNSDISIVNAQKGTIYFSNNAKVKEAVGKKIELKNNVGITYGSGLINVNFTSGPSGSWSLQGWGEIK